MFVYKLFKSKATSWCSEFNKLWWNNFRSFNFRRTNTTFCFQSELWCSYWTSSFCKISYSKLIFSNDWYLIWFNFYIFKTLFFVNCFLNFIFRLQNFFLNWASFNRIKRFKVKFNPWQILVVVNQIICMLCINFWKSHCSWFRSTNYV